MSRMSIMEYSERWFPYPYPQISAVEGPISGMEYPMIAMENKSADKYELYNVVTHEIGHMWFPMIVGSNERMHMWQDEGFNTFINYFSEARRYPGEGHVRGARRRTTARLVEQYMQHNADEPLEINPGPHQSAAARRERLREDGRRPGAAARRDPRTAGVRRSVPRVRAPLGVQASRRRPTSSRPWKTSSGKRLDWFFREWFLENPHFDQAIDTVLHKQVGDIDSVAGRCTATTRAACCRSARASRSPTARRRTSTIRRRSGARTRRSYVRRYEFKGKKLTKIELDPDKRLVDIDRTNNVWPKGG